MNVAKTGRSVVRSKRSMIATPHYLASSAGIRVLNRGGSAVDAAIAANTVLCVVYPHMGGLGGDGFWLITNPKGKGVKAINASGQAAQLATRDYYKVRGHKEKIPFRGPLAALTVPGVVDGWRLAYEEYGKLDWKDLFTDAIYYARNGMAVATSLSDWLQKDLSELSSYPSTSDIFLPNGRVPLEGEPLIQTDLAKSLDEIAKNGPREGFYESSITKKICDDLGPEGSPLQPEDFSKYHADWVNPISITYHGYTIYELPPNTQGFSALQILNILERLDIVSMGEGTVDYYHNMAEAVKVAFADRDAWLTDPKFVDIPLDIFLSKDYAAQRRQLICSDSALEMKKVEPGIPFNTQASRRSPGGGTCYFCVADEDKLVVSVIQSIYFDFGSAVVAKDTGILLQNRGSFFSLDEKHVNTLEPGKKTFHTLIPAMMFEDGDPYMAYGAMGGEGQPQTQAAIVTRLIDFGFDIQQAIEAPRWLMGRTWGNESQKLYLEGRISDEIARELKRRGQQVQMLSDWDDNMGHAQAIIINKRQNYYEGGADPRGDGIAIGN